MALRKNAPTRVVWVVCLLLYAMALLSHFRVVHVRADVSSWAWIIGFGLLLLATSLRRL